jgi:carbamoyl-phosphate synthase large subunit
MKRVLVVGPGPRRLGDPGDTSSHAADAADAFAAAGDEVVVVDCSPTSALLWSSHRRYVEPLTAETIARIVEIERIDAVCAPAARVRDAISTAPVNWIDAGPAHTPAPLPAGPPLVLIGPDPSTLPAPGATIPGPAEHVADVAAAARRLASREAARRGRTLRVGAAGAVDFAPTFLARARMHERAAPPGTTEIHVLVLTDAPNARARVLGTFEHVEHAPVHAADAAAVFPSLSASETALRSAEEQSVALAIESGARGIVTVRWALGASPSLLGLTGGITAHVLSLGLATGVDLVAESVRLALGEPFDTSPSPTPSHVAVEEHVFPFADVGASDTRLDRGPFSTGTVLALGDTIERAYLRALAAMGVSLHRPREASSSAVMLAGGDEHASALADVGRRLFAIGFEILATEEAARWLTRMRIRHRVASDAASLVLRREVAALVAATSSEHPSARAELRRAALVARVPCFTTIDLTRVAVRALEQESNDLPRALEDWITR